MISTDFYAYKSLQVIPKICCIEVFFRYLLKLKFKKKIGFSVHFVEQWHFEAGLFALKSDFCVILRNPYILLYFIMMIIVVYSMLNSENKTYD